MADVDALCRLYHARLRRFFSSKVAPQDVEELVQRTWFEILRRNEREGAHAKPIADHAWGYVLAFGRFTLLHHYRDRRQALGRSFDPETDSVEALDPSLSRLLSMRRRIERLEFALRTLPIDVQMLLEARYLEHLSGAELAVMFKIPHATVRTRLARARRSLDERMRALEEDPTSPPEEPLHDR